MARGEGLGEGTAESCWEHDSCQGATRSRHGAPTMVRSRAAPVGPRSSPRGDAKATPIA
eukprot:CAMPEP_0116958406 /NCGR_PEP_ID=MMETSP0467-20121206/44620_1 /TAXON_ID=283647 /ORGANISM="Mesodinium pulex, Strain SPMC105" /LENGTH=58 /DNA_ID=CAMNT_0004645485 /DNA_START=104 /DNA_END=276 /DNA_ORIENTATION=-